MEVHGVHVVCSAPYILQLLWLSGRIQLGVTWGQFDETLLYCRCSCQVWDLETQHCVQTCVDHRSEVWALDVSPDQTRLITGASDNQIRVWNIAPYSSTSTKPVATATATAAGAPVDGATVAPVNDNTVLQLLGSVPSMRRERCLGVTYSRCGSFVGVVAAGKGMEVFRLRSADEVKRRIARRKRRQREKKRERGGDDVVTPGDGNAGTVATRRLFVVVVVC